MDMILYILRGFGVLDPLLAYIIATVVIGLIVKAVNRS